MIGPDMPEAYVRIVQDLITIERRVAETEERIKQHSEPIKSSEARGLEAEFQSVIVQANKDLLALHLGVHARLLEHLSRVAAEADE